MRVAMFAECCAEASQAKPFLHAYRHASNIGKQINTTPHHTHTHTDTQTQTYTISSLIANNNNMQAFKLKFSNAKDMERAFAKAIFKAAQGKRE